MTRLLAGNLRGDGAIYSSDNDWVEINKNNAEPLMPLHNAQLTQSWKNAFHCIGGGLTIPPGFASLAACATKAK
ncbi:MAG TPA: hypothetical protein VE988_23005 [Gemmataceae bacterium]|nr:hypothetical protein [Gemmataceae bacterium]